MSKVINPSQQGIVFGVSPGTAYTRVIGIPLNVPLDGAWHFAVSPPVGQNVWVKRFKLRHTPRVVNVANYTTFEIMAGNTRATTLGDIGAWDHVIRNIAQGGASLTMQMSDGYHEYEEYMQKLYAGESRRFGILARRYGAGADYLQLTMEISEG